VPYDYQEHRIDSGIYVSPIFISAAVMGMFSEFGFSEKQFARLRDTLPYALPSLI
jgi:hypothetical protein